MIIEIAIAWAVVSIVVSLIVGKCIANQDKDE